MSENKTLEVEVTHPDILEVDVDFGQTLTKIVAPEHYMGPFEFYPSDEDQVVPVKDKTSVEDIVIPGIDFVGYSKAELVWDETLESATSQRYFLTKQDGSDFGSYDKLVVDMFNYVSAGNSGFRQYWNKKKYGGNPSMMVSVGENTYSYILDPLHIEFTIHEAENMIEATASGRNINPNAHTLTSCMHDRSYKILEDGFQEINMYGWWSRTVPAGTRVVIKGYHKL